MPLKRKGVQSSKRRRRRRWTTPNHGSDSKAQFQPQSSQFQIQNRYGQESSSRRRSSSSCHSNSSSGRSSSPFSGESPDSSPSAGRKSSPDSRSRIRVSSPRKAGIGKFTNTLNSCACPTKTIQEDVGQGVSNFRPRPGDIIILQSERRHRYPYVCQGYVTLYLDDVFFKRTLIQDHQTLDENYAHKFLKGDIIVRMGTFDGNWRWHPAAVVQVFVCETKHFWWLVAKLGWHPLQPPVRREALEGPHMTVPSRDLYFKPRDGDLIIRGIPGLGTENLKKWKASWWYPGMETKLFDMLVRAGFQGVSRDFQNHNSTEVVVEMYWLYDTVHYWIFVGRDSYTYAPDKNSAMSFAYTFPISRSNVSPGWQHVQDVLSRKKSKTFFRLQKPGKQKRVLDQPFDHHLPPVFDHLGFDDLAIG